MTLVAASRGQAQALQNIELATTRPLEVWLAEIREIRARYPDHVIMASIMSDADSPDDWKMLTVETQNAGAQIIELNLACPHGLPEMGMGAAIGANPELVARVTRWSADVADVPVIAKLTATCSDIKGVASAAMSSGASGLAAINTVDSISGVDLDTLVPSPAVASKSTHGGLSGPAIKPIALRCVADIAQLGLPGVVLRRSLDLAGCRRVRAPRCLQSPGLHARHVQGLQGHQAAHPWVVAVHGASAASQRSRTSVVLHSFTW